MRASWVAEHQRAASLTAEMCRREGPFSRLRPLSLRDHVSRLPSDRSSGSATRSPPLATSPPGRFGCTRSGVAEAAGNLAATVPSGRSAGSSGISAYNLGGQSGAAAVLWGRGPMHVLAVQPRRIPLVVSYGAQADVARLRGADARSLHRRLTIRRLPASVPSLTGPWS